MKKTKKLIIPEIPEFKLPYIKIDDIISDPEYKKWLKRIKLKEKIMRLKSTLIIGARGKDGIVIGADQKVVRGESSSLENKIKVFEIRINENEKSRGYIIFSASGYTGIWEDFLEDFTSLLQENLNQGNIKTFKDIKMLAEEAFEWIYLRYLPSLGRGFINFILGGLRNITHGDALLYNFIPIEPEIELKEKIPPAYGERIKDIIILGHGTPHAKTIARFLLKEEFVNSLTIEELAQRIYACIKWVASNGIDEYVGGEPQVLGLKDNKPEVIDFSEKIDKDKINRKLTEIQQTLINWKLE